jgi:CheY-like chemotaxis protein
VLIVDDEVEHRYLLSQVLRELGYVVFEAVSGHEALQLLRSSIRFDAVITDVQMPGEIDGILLAETVRSGFPAMKVVVVSGIDVTERLCNKGIAFFRKPYGVTEIVNHLKDH